MVIYHVYLRGIISKFTHHIIHYLIIGTGIFLYPSISNYLAEKNQVEAIRNYDELVVNLDKASLEEEKNKAKIYNENLSGDPVHDPFVQGSGYALPENYKEVLNFAGDGVMGYIDIPKISVYLPIYHGTSEEVLEKGVGDIFYIHVLDDVLTYKVLPILLGANTVNMKKGAVHLTETSYPIGGENANSVIAAHRGYGKATMFRHIEKLEVGDEIFIRNFKEELTYKVYEIKIINPDDIRELEIKSGEDIITLITCHPYRVNNQRYIVKAQRAG